MSNGHKPKVRREVFSSGGVGDSLIVGLKIQHQFPLVENEIVWRHFEKHSCHADPCLDIQQRFADQAEIHIFDTPEKCAKEMCEAVNGIYLDTVIKGFMNPYLHRPIRAATRVDLGVSALDKHVVVQMHAGRMHDNTKRGVDWGVVHGLADRFPRKKIVLVGPEKIKAPKEYVNYTGRTTSIIEVFEIINKCSLFVGQDGVMAYYAMMLKKPTLVAFHLPNLVNHYWNEAWAHHAICFVGAGNTLGNLPADPRVEELYYMAEYQ